MFKASLAVLLLTIASNAFARTEPFVHGVTFDDFWIPHTLDPTGATAAPGVLPEALDVIFDGAGLRWSAALYPSLAETRAAFDRGETDFQVTSLSWVAQPVADDTVFSSAFYVTSDRLIFAPGAPVATARCGSMAELTVWGVVGYQYPCANQMEIRRAGGENELVRGVSDGVFPSAIVEETTARFWARRLGAPVNLGPVIDVAELRLRLRAPSPGVLERLNVSIARALRYGAIKDIRRRYIGADPVATIVDAP